MAKRLERKENANDKRKMTSKKIMKLERIRGKRKIIKFVNAKKNKLRDLSDIFKKDFKDVEIKQMQFENNFLYFNTIILLFIFVLFIYLIYIYKY